jgi:hypothetical protein
VEGVLFGTIGCGNGRHGLLKNTIREFLDMAEETTTEIHLEVAINKQ